MAKIKIKHQKGLTLVELMITVAVSAIIALSLGSVMADSLTGWNTMYSRITSTQADAYVARKAFDHWVRQASSMYNITITNSSLTVYYYSSKSSTTADSHADFTYANNKLTIACTTPPVTTIQATIPNVTNCCFQQSGDKAVQMLLTLQDTSKPQAAPINVFSSAYLNSK